MNIADNPSSAVAPAPFGDDPATFVGPVTPTGEPDPRTPAAINRSWVISLFGTAVGAGILFLPINAGAGGLWPLLVVTLLIGPMTYFSHRALSRFVCLSPRPGEDITLVAKDYFGSGVGSIITVLYFLAIYPIVLIYGVSITNTVDSFIVNQFHGPHIPRALLSFVLIALMMTVMIFGERLMLLVTGAIVYPLIFLLFAVSLYLIPQWKLGSFTEAHDWGTTLKFIFMIIPVLVFAFNHSPAISQFSLAMQRAHGPNAERNASQTLRNTAIVLTLFTMLFVWSCALTLGNEGLAEARAQNLTVLSYLANVNESPIISFVGPVVAIVAIVSSFFGHYLGTAEGAEGIVDSFAPNANKKTVKVAVAAFIGITTWLAAIVNPSILGLIESLSGPVIAAILYLMPMYAIYKVPRLAPYRKQASNIFVIVMGLIAISGIFFKLFQ